MPEESLNLIYQEYNLLSKPRTKEKTTKTPAIYEKL